jgi:hypothetical protein
MIQFFLRFKVSFIFIYVFLTGCVFTQEPSLSSFFSLLKNLDLDDVESNDSAVLDEVAIENSFDDDFFKNLMSGFIEVSDEIDAAEPHEEMDREKSCSEIDTKKSQETFDKFNEHVNSYFQKVYVVREKFFLNMTPEDIAKALDNIVQILAFKPWMYVEHFCKEIEKTMSGKQKIEWIACRYDFDVLVNKFETEGLNVKNVKLWLKRGGGFWEFISDQLALFHNFIKRCRVDVNRNTLFLEPDAWSDWFCFSQSKPKKVDKGVVRLRDYWEKNGITVYHNLYVLGFVYSSYLFLESIRTRDLYLAMRYYDEDLKPIMENLRGSSREADFRTYMERYKGVLDIFKAEERADRFDDEDDKYFNELLEFIDID